jgi:small subunit ribosomal protein S7e
MNSRARILKKKGVKPSQLETRIAQLFTDIERSGVSFNKRMRPLKIAGACDVEVNPAKSAVAVFVPFPQLIAYHRIHTQLLPELEKKLKGKQVVIVAKRRIMPKPLRGRKYKQPRPRSRTLADVHEKILDDIVYPADIIGKRIHYRPDGTSFTKVHFDLKDKVEMEPRLDTLRTVYAKLTGKDVTFEFPK